MNIFNLGPMELIVIGVVALIVVGPRQLPELGRMLGRWMKTFREASDEMKRTLYMEDEFRRQPPPRPTPPLEHTPAEDDEPAYLTDEGASEGSYNGEDLDPDQERVATEESFSSDETDSVAVEEPSEEAKRSYEETDYDHEGAD